MISNTLTYDQEKCTNCGMCTSVCPHAVFQEGTRRVTLHSPERCMECGACERNCPTQAISVESGVGCASGMILAALKGNKGEACCGESGSSSCS